MNYQRIYNQLILNRQNNPLPKETYAEKHHIIPKSHGGSNDKSNLVRLSAREHFIAHWLLWRIHRDNKMANAFFSFRMNKDKSRYKNSYGFEEARIAKSNLMKGNTNLIGHNPSQETRNKISKAGIGRKHSEKSKIKMSQALTGQKRSEETCRRIGISKKGMIHSKETKLKMSKSRMGIKRPKEVHDKLLIANLDTQLYTFVHMNGEVRIDIKHNMRKEFGIHIYDVVNGKRNICKGWSLVA